MKCPRSLLLILMVTMLAAVQACGGGGGGDPAAATPTGAVQVSLTDAPGDYDHVFITVKSLSFHRSEAAGPRAGGWHRYSLPAPEQVDLLDLSNGNMRTVWDDILLPAGTYRQIRIELAPTFDPLSSAGPANYVVTGGNTYPLHIPDVEHGIKLAGVFTVTGNGTLRLAIDFDAGDDIVELREGTDYVLKPRLKCFDLDEAGAIVGRLSTAGSVSSTRFVIKAERLATAEEMLASGATSSFHVVRRWTVPRPDGSFVLYPVSTRVTGTWDIVVRGLSTRTMIVKGVTVTKGSTPQNGATDLGVVSTAASPADYTVGGTIQSPTGAWVQFYQTLPGAGEHPYEIRFRHFNPLWGGFPQKFLMNNDQIAVGNFVMSGATVTFTAVSPVQGAGRYDAVAGAALFERSTAVPVSSSTGTVRFPGLSVMPAFQNNTVSGQVVLHNPAKMNGKMDNGLLFAVAGGMIVNSINIGTTAMGSLPPGGQIVSGGTYTMTDLPGGFPGAFYGIDAVGWSTDMMPMSLMPYRAIAVPRIVDLTEGNGTATMDLFPLW